MKRLLEEDDANKTPWKKPNKAFTEVNKKLVVDSESENDVAKFDSLEQWGKRWHETKKGFLTKKQIKKYSKEKMELKSGYEFGSNYNVYDHVQNPLDFLMEWSPKKFKCLKTSELTRLKKINLPDDSKKSRSSGKKKKKGKSNGENTDPEEPPKRKRRKGARKKLLESTSDSEDDMENDVVKASSSKKPKKNQKNGKTHTEVKGKKRSGKRKRKQDEDTEESDTESELILESDEDYVPEKYSVSKPKSFTTKKVVVKKRRKTKEAEVSGMKPKEDEKTIEKNREIENGEESYNEIEEANNSIPTPENVSPHSDKKNDRKEKRNATDGEVTKERRKEKKGGSSKSKKTDKKQKIAVEEKGVEKISKEGDDKNEVKCEEESVKKTIKDESHMDGNKEKKKGNKKNGKEKTDEETHEDDTLPRGTLTRSKGRDQHIINVLSKAIEIESKKDPKCKPEISIRDFKLEHIIDKPGGPKLKLSDHAKEWLRVMREEQRKEDAERKERKQKATKAMEKEENVKIDGDVAREESIKHEIKVQIHRQPLQQPENAENTMTENGVVEVNEAKEAITENDVLANPNAEQTKPNEEKQERDIVSDLKNELSDELDKSLEEEELKEMESLLTNGKKKNKMYGDIYGDEEGKSKEKKDDTRNYS